MLYRDHVGIIFPYSLLSFSKFGVPDSVLARLGACRVIWGLYRDYTGVIGIIYEFC